MTYDLLISGGRVIDPHAGLDGPADIAVTGGRVVKVAPGIEPASARQVIDATGQLVLPGLIDMHTHMFHGFTYWGLNPDTMAHDSGVTTWVDAGSAGAVSLRGLRKYIFGSTTVNVRAFVNVSVIGLIGTDMELALPEYLDEELLSRAITANPDLLVGIKVRMASPTVGTLGLKGLEVARRVADRFEMPIMVHIADAPPAITDVLALMREGDIVTHAFTGCSMKLVDDDGTPLASTREALDRGVLLDVGHGAGSLGYSSAAALMAAGIAPNTISTDMHQMSLHADTLMSSDAVESSIIRLRDVPEERFDLPLCMSKFMALGMPLNEVVAATTARPAEILNRTGEIGTLKAGAAADIALFDLEEGSFRYKDVYGESWSGSQRLKNVSTILGGRVLQPMEVEESVPWIDRIPQ